MDIRQIVGDNVRLLRHRKKWPQEELAIRAKMSKTYIGDIENGKVAVTVVRLEKLAKALKVPLPLLVTLDGHKLAD